MIIINTARTVIVRAFYLEKRWRMLTLLVWCIVNGFLFHFNASIITDETKIIIIVICIASDLNLFATFRGA